MSLRRRHSEFVRSVPSRSTSQVRVRWGHLSELDGRFRVPHSAGYQAYPLRLKHLAAWRRMHKVAPGHMPVRMSGTRRGVRPSSNLPLKVKEAFCRARPSIHARPS